MDFFSYIYNEEFNIYILSQLNSNCPLSYDAVINHLCDNDEQITLLRRKIMFEYDGALAYCDDLQDSKDFYEIIIARSENGIKKIIDYLDSLRMIQNLREDE